MRDIESACFRHPYYVVIVLSLNSIDGTGADPVWRAWKARFWTDRITAVGWPTGFEPAWFGTTIRCIAILPQPQYPMRGSNPSSSDWESEIIPLDQSGIYCWNQIWTDTLSGMNRLLLPIKLFSISSRSRIRTCVVLGMSQSWNHLQSILRVGNVRFERLPMLPKHVCYHYTTLPLLHLSVSWQVLPPVFKLTESHRSQAMLR